MDRFPDKSEIELDAERAVAILTDLLFDFGNTGDVIIVGSSLYDLWINAGKLSVDRAGDAMVDPVK